MLFTLHSIVAYPSKEEAQFYWYRHKKCQSLLYGYFLIVLSEAVMACRIALMIASGFSSGM